MIKDEVNIIKPLLEKEIVVELDMKNGKPASIERKDTHNFNAKRLLNKDTVVLNHTIYLVERKYNEITHSSFVFSAYNPIYKLGIVYVNNSYENLEKVIVLNNLSDTIYWFDKVNNMVLNAINKTTFDVDIIKRNNLVPAITGVKPYSYFIKPSDILITQEYYKEDNFNMFFINGNTITDLKSFYNREVSTDEVVSMETKISKATSMVNCICQLYLFRNSRLTNEFLSFGKMLKTNTMNDVLNKELNNNIQSL